MHLSLRVHAVVCVCARVRLRACSCKRICDDGVWVCVCVFLTAGTGFWGLSGNKSAIAEMGTIYLQAVKLRGSDATAAKCEQLMTSSRSLLTGFFDVFCQQPVLKLANSKVSDHFGGWRWCINLYLRSSRTWPPPLPEMSESSRPRRR